MVTLRRQVMCYCCKFSYRDTVMSMWSRPGSQGLCRTMEVGFLLTTCKQVWDSCYFGLETKKGKSQYNSCLAVRQTSFFRLDGKLQPCPKMGLMAYCAACSVMSGRATVGLKHSLYDRPLWQSCSWLVRGILSLSHHQMPPPFTILALYALCSLCNTQVLGSWSEFLHIQKKKKSHFWTKS